ncbi:DUF1496 domain-containing protein [Dongshaea marina]|uniref:DUF1496 domain-containing protein n=1 Tax=Dongshaea marina TaxID=2047966 RepID=UPI000D3EDF06|nr:DUF1496 domain-containing protein [Dongshaea marina]
MKKLLTPLLLSVSLVTCSAVANQIKLEGDISSLVNRPDLKDMCLYKGQPYSVGSVIQAGESGVLLQCGYKVKKTSPDTIASAGEIKPDRPQWVILKQN